MSASRVLPQCKVPTSTISAEEDSNSPGRGRSLERKRRASDPETNVSDKLLELSTRIPKGIANDDISHKCNRPRAQLLQSNQRWSKIAFHSILHILLLSAGLASGELSRATKDMVRRWAPKLWIHHEEKFRPSNVEYFLENTRVVDQSGAVIQGSNSIGRFCLEKLAA